MEVFIIIFNFVKLLETTKKIWNQVRNKLTGKRMIIDITGIVLTPGNCGVNCLGNGLHKNFLKQTIPCCCDECDYMICCLTDHDNNTCTICNDQNCPYAYLHKK